MSDRDWAAAQAPRLLEQARAEALAEAREFLRRRLVEALLDAAAEPAAPPATAPRAGAPAARRDEVPGARPTGSDRGASGSGLWVYGVVPAGVAAPAGPGVDGAPVRLVAAGDVAALATPVPLDRFGADALQRSLEDLGQLEALARAHQEVLDRALAGGVVPFRLCTIYESEDHVREMLEREQATLAAGLERLRGSAEWGVKAYLAAVPAEPAPAAHTGTEWLERKRDDRASAAAAQEAAEQRAAAIHARLGEHAAAAVVSRPHERRLSGHDGEMLLNAAYLVANDRADGFRDVVAALAREHEPHGLQLELTGPWAAYHFVAETPDG